MVGIGSHFCSNLSPLTGKQEARGEGCQDGTALGIFSLVQGISLQGNLPWFWGPIPTSLCSKRLLD